MGRDGNGTAKKIEDYVSESKKWQMLCLAVPIEGHGVRPGPPVAQICPRCQWGNVFWGPCLKCGNEPPQEQDVKEDVQPIEFGAYVTMVIINVARRDKLDLDKPQIITP